MAIIHLTEASSGAPRCSGTNGDLCAVFDWGLVQNGWTIDYSSGNKRAYRAASGNRFPLYIEHDSATSGNAGLCLTRGCESQAAGVLVDPFPTVAKVANTSSNILVSNAASTTSRAFDLFVAPTWVLFFTNFSGSTNIWEMFRYGDFSPTLSADSYNTNVLMRNSASTSVAINFATASSYNPGVLSSCTTRSYDATVKSTTGGFPIAGASTFGGLGGAAAAAQAGPSTGIDMCKVAIMDTGSLTGTPNTSVGLPIRGWVPNLWAPMHAGKGTLNSRDTFTNTTVNPTSDAFIVFTVGNATTNGFVIVEQFDNAWAPPT